MVILQVALFVTWAGRVCSQVSETADGRLAAHLSEVSSPLVLPRTHPSHTININLTLALNYLVGINEKAESMTAVLWIVQQWKNPFMVWNMSDYEGIHSYVLSSKEIWTPRVWILELIESERADESVYGDFTPAVVDNIGNTIIYPTYHMTTSCNLDFFRFPFDKQRCPLTLVSWSYRAEDVQYELLAEPFTTHTYTKGEWALLSFNSIPGPNFVSAGYPLVNLSLLSFEIHLSRNPLVQIMNIVFPLFTLNLIVLASLFMESDTAGRIGLGTTAVLSYTVLLLIVMEKLPASSTRMPFIGVVFLCSLVFTLVITLWAVALGKLLPNTGTQTTQGWVTAAINPPRTIVRLGRRANRRYSVNGPTSMDELGAPSNESGQAKEEEGGAGGNVEIDVLRFARLVDRVLFVIYLTFNIVSGFVMLVWSVN